MTHLYIYVVAVQHVVNCTPIGATIITGNVLVMFK